MAHKEFHRRSRAHRRQASPRSATRSATQPTASGFNVPLSRKQRAKTQISLSQRKISPGCHIWTDLPKALRRRRAPVRVQKGSPGLILQSDSFSALCTGAERTPGHKAEGSHRLEASAGCATGGAPLDPVPACWVFFFLYTNPKIL